MALSITCIERNSLHECVIEVDSVFHDEMELYIASMS